MKNNIVIDSELSIHPVDGFDYFTQHSVGTKYLIAKLSGPPQNLRDSIPDETLDKWTLAENEQLFISFVKGDGKYQTDPILMSHSPAEGLYYLPVPNEVIHQTGEWRIVACKKLNWDENTGIADAVMFGKNEFTFEIANSIPSFDEENAKPITEHDLINAVETIRECVKTADEIKTTYENLVVEANNELENIRQASAQAENSAETAVNAAQSVQETIPVITEASSVAQEAAEDAQSAATAAATSEQGAADEAGKAQQLAEIANFAAISAEASAEKVQTNAAAIKAETDYLDGIKKGSVAVSKAVADENGNNIANQFANINEKIPSSASETNKVATEAFVNSSINNFAAFYITSNAQGDAFPTRASLLNATTYYYGGQVRVPTQNDYAIVLADESQPKGPDGNYPTTRYSYQGSEWSFQYVVNNTSLTQAQVDAINSGITAEKIAEIDAELDKKVDIEDAVTGVKGDNETEYRTGQVNLTAANVGALPLTGGTVKGNLLVQNPESSSASVGVVHKITTDYVLYLRVSSSAGHKRGLYDLHNNKWIIYTEGSDGIVYIDGKIPYSKPEDGIPESDLSQEVQDKLNANNGSSSSLYLYTITIKGSVDDGSLYVIGQIYSTKSISPYAGSDISGLASHLYTNFGNISIIVQGRKLTDDIWSITVNSNSIVFSDRFGNTVSVSNVTFNTAVLSPGKSV